MAQTVMNLVTVGFSSESLTVSNTVQVLTRTIFKDSATSGGALTAFLTNSGAPIMFTYDNIVTPTSSIGHVLADGGILVLNGQNQMEAFKCIRQGSVNSTIYVTYERI